MVSFRTGISLLLIPLLPLFAFAQPSDSTDAVKRYRFEAADSLVKKKRFEQAVWTYINLYPRYPDSVTVMVRGLQGKIWDDDLPAFIRTTFARFAPMDPDISTFDFTGPTMDTVQLKRKAAWSEALIKRVKLN